MDELIRKLLPILLLLVIGYFAKQRKLFSANFIEELKGMIIKIALPAVLFDAFSTMSLQISYLLLFVLIFVYCCLLYFIGYGLHKFFPNTFKRFFTKGYMTGFEFGMIGVGLFGAIWGMDKLPIIMLVGFGHELFIWFFYVQFISKDTGSINILGSIKQFIKMPTIIAIVLGVTANLSGFRLIMNENVIGQSLLSVIQFLKPLTSPLILIVIGYTMVFQRTHLREAAVYIFSRLVLTLSLGMLVFIAVMKIIPGVDDLFIQAFFAFILLPAPYILPLYIKDQVEATFFTQLLIYSTAVSFVGYGILVWFSF